MKTSDCVHVHPEVFKHHSYFIDFLACLFV